MFKRLFPGLAKLDTDDWLALILGTMWGWIIIFGAARDIMESLGWVK